MDPITLDCRGQNVPETGLAIFKIYNKLEKSAEFDVLIDHYGAGLRMWLIEAGARHNATRSDDGHWQLTIIRAASPGQGTIPGIHHVVTGPSGKIWTCERASRLACFDGDSGALIKTAEIAKKASHIAIDPQEKWVFVADPGENHLIAVDAKDLSVKHAWPAPGGPQLPLVTQDGIACVTGGGSGTLTIVRPSGGDFEVQTVEIGSCPHDPVTTPDGAYIFVPCAGDGEIVKLRLSDGRILGRYKAGDGAAHLTLHPDGTKIYCANSFDGTASCVSIEGDLIAQAPSGNWAHQPEITPDGKTVFVANFFDDTLSVFDAETLKKRGELPSDPYPHGLDVAPDGKTMIATGFGSDHLRIYDAQKLQEIARIKVGRGSSHTAFTQQGHAYVGCSVSDHLARIDISARECVGTFAIGA